MRTPTMQTRNALSSAFGSVIVVIGVVIGMAVLLDGCARVGAIGGVLPQATAIHHYGAESGKITDTLTSPDNVTIKFVAVQRGTNEWLFHVHVHNNASHSVPFLDTSANHFFLLTGRGLPGTPYTSWDQLSVRLTPPSQADLAAHPALVAIIAAGADTDGWLVADFSNFKYPPNSLLYVYGAVTSPACTNPLDQSTCQPSTGYRTLVWQL